MLKWAFQIEFSEIPRSSLYYDGLKGGQKSVRLNRKRQYPVSQILVWVHLANSCRCWEVKISMKEKESRVF